MNETIERLKNAVRTYPDFPSKGVQFRDIFGIFSKAELIDDCVGLLVKGIEQIADQKPLDAIVGLEARGFLLGPMLASRLKCSFVPMRKANKLPGECFSETYDLEYGTATLELSKNALSPGANVVLIDDLLAIGGTLTAAYNLALKASVTVLGSIVIIELLDLKGRAKLEACGLSVHSLITF